MSIHSFNIQYRPLMLCCTLYRAMLTDLRSLVDELGIDLDRVLDVDRVLSGPAQARLINGFQFSFFLHFC